MSAQKILIQPANVMFQWWDFVPYYTGKEFWKKAPIELSVDEVKIIYKRGPAFFLQCNRDDQDYLLYLGQIPEQLYHVHVQEVGPIEALKIIRKFPSKWKKLYPRMLIFAFLIVGFIKFIAKVMK